MLDVLLICNGNVEIERGIRYDNSRVAEHVHSINSTAKERRTIGFLESNSEGMGANPWLALSHITRP